MEYQVTITETLSRTECVEAVSAKIAEELIRYRYRKSDIVLDDTHFVGVNFNTVSSTTAEVAKPILQPPSSFYKSPNHDFNLLHGDTFELLPQFNFKFDMIFADPPYFLSSGGISVQSGKVVCVDKGDWDKSMSQDDINAFNLKWLSLCREKLKDNGTIWISGTYHNIFSVANCLTQLGYKILNVITWAKTNPPPNISCRYFSIRRSSLFGRGRKKRCLITTTTSWWSTSTVTRRWQMFGVCLLLLPGRKLARSIPRRNHWDCWVVSLWHQQSQALGCLTPFCPPNNFFASFL